MKLFLFSASVFYLLGLKLTSQIEIKPPIITKSTTIESKTYPGIKNNIPSTESKPNLNKEDTTISSEIKSSRLTKTPKNKTFPQS
jgi:hypothetical protein